MPGTLVFSHANSFPAGTYRLLFDAWRTAGWRVLALPRIGHDPAYPVSLYWPRLREELADFVTAQAPGEKVHFVGHSLGGFLSLMTACRHPELAAQVLMLDSPLVAGWRSHGVQLARLTGLAARLSPGRVAGRRRQAWPSRDAAVAHFAAKAAFARWQPEVLGDYVDSGTEADPEGPPGGVRLAFRREIEAQIYDTLPTRLSAYMRRHPLRCRASFIGGTQSAELRQAGMAATRALVGARLDWVEGTHLFPMERPAETAAAVLHRLADVGAG